MKENLGQLTTEGLNQRSLQIDRCEVAEILKAINREDKEVPLAVEKELPNIEKAVELIVSRLKQGGRLIYVGAGTSGRLGVLDASECPPTYGTDPEMVQGVIAGGVKALYSAVEGAEDREDWGRQAILQKAVTEKDVVVGIAASGRTPFVLGAVREARKQGAATVGLSCNPVSPLKAEVDIAITPVVGPEIIMGSTRMKAGTAQKLVLNMLSTASMIRLGKVYGNLMVDLKPSNHKLMERSVRIIMLACGIGEEEARDYLEKSGYRPKTAIVMIKGGCSREEAEKALEKADGFISKAIEGMKGKED